MSTPNQAPSREAVAAAAEISAYLEEQGWPERPAINQHIARLVERATNVGRLREIVDRLPKTADGVTVIPGMIVYYIRHNYVRWAELYGWSKPDKDGFCHCYHSQGQSQIWEWRGIYGTQESAEAALASDAARGNGGEGRE